MNDTSYHNGSNYFNGTRRWHRRTCIGQGLDCSELYTVENLIAYITTIGNFVFVPFILYLIFVKVKDSFFKYFTLNAIFTCITSAIAALITDVVHFIFIFRGIRGKVYLIYVQRWAAQFTHVAFMWFHALLLYAAIVSYLPYVKPVFFASKFAKKSHIPYYAVLHISILLWGTFTILLYYRTGNSVPYHLTHATFFIALFTVAVMGSIKISKYKSFGENFIEVSKLQQKRLYSFIIYTYSIEVITLPMFVYACVRIICIFAGYENNLALNNFTHILDTVNYFFRRMRLISIILITIFACEPFRHATFSLFIKKKWTTEVKSMPTLKTKLNS